MKPFIAVYTHKCKNYAREEFIHNLIEVTLENTVSILDNSDDSEENTFEIKRLVSGHDNIEVSHIIVNPQPKHTLFQRNVLESINFLRDEFLRSDCDVFIIIESDIIPEVTCLKQFEIDIQHLDQFAGKQWAIISMPYYVGYHDPELLGLQEVENCLSGCTLYKRELIESTPFEWNEEMLGCFPDSCMSLRAKQKGYSLWCNFSHWCKHLEITPGNRGQNLL